MSSGANSGEFSLAHVVALQHAILHAVSGGNGFHDLGADDAPAVSPRESVHAFYDRRSEGMNLNLAPLPTRMTANEDCRALDAPAFHRMEPAGAGRHGRAGRETE